MWFVESSYDNIMKFFVLNIPGTELGLFHRIIESILSDQIKLHCPEDWRYARLELIENRKDVRELKIYCYRSLVFIAKEVKHE